MRRRRIEAIRPRPAQRRCDPLQKIGQHRIIGLAEHTANTIRWPTDGYRLGPLHVHARRGEPTGPLDERFAATPEAHRAYLNTIDYAEARGL